MKDTYVNAKKRARKVGKMVIYESQILRLTLYKTRLHTLLTKKLSPSKMTRKGFVHSVSFWIPQAFSTETNIVQGLFFSN